MKLTKTLPVILLALVLAWLFLPGTNNAPPAPTPTAALTLVSPSPTAAPTPASSAPEQTAKPVSSAPPAAATPERIETPKPLSTRIPAATPSPEPTGEELDEYGIYTSKEDLALYIHTYGHLPENFIRKKDAEALGWSGGPLDRVLPGMCIGGDYFGNYEGLLPKARGRRWMECDVDTLGARSRGGKRIIFSNDGLIYYTGDHYESFELLYDGP